MRNLSVKKLTMTGVMAALTFVMTCVLRAPAPVPGGYIHLGDGAVFLSAMLLGPLGIPAAAIGSALADVLSGSLLYVLPTMGVKALMALIAWKGWKDGAALRALCTFLLAELVMIAGYFAFEAAVYGTAAAWGAAGANCIQGAAGAALGMACHALYPRLKRLVR